MESLGFGFKGALIGLDNIHSVEPISVLLLDETSLRLWRHLSIYARRNVQTRTCVMQVVH